MACLNSESDTAPSLLLSATLNQCCVSDFLDTSEALADDGGRRDGASERPPAALKGAVEPWTVVGILCGRRARGVRARLVVVVCVCFWAKICISHLGICNKHGNHALSRGRVPSSSSSTASSSRQSDTLSSKAFFGVTQAPSSSSSAALAAEPIFSCFFSFGGGDGFSCVLARPRRQSPPRRQQAFLRRQQLFFLRRDGLPAPATTSSSFRNWFILRRKPQVSFPGTATGLPSGGNHKLLFPERASRPSATAEPIPPPMAVTSCSPPATAEGSCSGGDNRFSSGDSNRLLLRR